jgi:hypothetical protein
VYFAWFCLFSLRLLGAEYALCGVLVSEWWEACGLLLSPTPRSEAQQVWTSWTQVPTPQMPGGCCMPLKFCSGLSICCSWIIKCTLWLSWVSCSAYQEGIGVLEILYNIILQKIQVNSFISFRHLLSTSLCSLVEKVIEKS